MPRLSERPAVIDWPWWKVIGLLVFLFGVLTGLLTLVPYYSSVALAIGIGLSVAGTIPVVWLRIWRTPNWWMEVAYAVVWPLFFLGLGARLLAAIIPVIWVWLIPLLAAYLLAWALPALNPALSALLWREQTAPQTRLGRGCLILMLPLAPVAGTIGASVGMFGSRFFEDRAPIYLIMGMLGSIVAIGMAFAFAYQYWPKRPWRKDEPEQEDKE